MSTSKHVKALCIHSLTYLDSTNWVSCSVQFSRSVVSDFLQPHESQHAKPPCPSPPLGVHSDSCPSSRWYHPAISSSGIPFSSCPPSLPASKSFPMSQLFTWRGQSIGASFSFSIIPSKEIPRLISFRMDWLDLLVLSKCTNWCNSQFKGKKEENETS